MQNYRPKSETAIIVAGCLKYRRSQFFSPFQSCHILGSSYFSPFRLFFRYFLGFFRRFNTGKHVQRQTNTKLADTQKNMLSAIIPEKAIILHTLEDYIHGKPNDMPSPISPEKGCTNPPNWRIVIGYLLGLQGFTTFPDGKSALTSSSFTFSKLTRVTRPLWIRAACNPRRSTGSTI